MASAIERIQVKLPAQFDPIKHQTKMLKLICDQYGDGWELESITDGKAVATRHVAITEVQAQSDGRSMEVRLPSHVKGTDGEKMAAKLAEANPGFHMTVFDPYRGRAVMTRLTEDEYRARDALAVALGVKAWEIQVQARRGGGFLLKLPRTYVPSKHDVKLDEAATTTIGQPGWYVRTEARTLTSEIIPAEPPTFPGMVPTPMPAKVEPFDHTNKAHFQTALGWRLPDPGQKKHEVFSIDQNAGGHVQIAGVSGGGKLQPLDTRIPVPISTKHPTGWATNAELEVGDLVYAVDGSETTVTGFSPITEEELYEVHFGDGQIVRCGPRHLWRVSTNQSRQAFRPVRLEGLLGSHIAEVIAEVPADAGGTRGEIETLVTQGLDGNDSGIVTVALGELPIDALGVSRADGELVFPVREVLRTLIERLHSTVMLEAVMETADMAVLLRENPGVGFSVRVASKIESESVLPIDSSVFGYTHRGPLPPEVLRASWAQRDSILSGLIARHGDGNHYGINAQPRDEHLVQVPSNVVDSLLELARSLGHLAWVDQSGVRIRVGKNGKHGQGSPWDEQNLHLRSTLWHEISAISNTGINEAMRCIAVEHPEHLYLTDGFIPTHNTVTINCYISQWLSKGAELVIIDLPSKSADFEWCKKYVRPGGWGCAGPDEAAVAIDLVMKEGERRADIIRKAGVADWKDLPRGKGFKPLIVVVDEVTGLYALEKVPKTSKNSPPKLFEIAEEAERINFAKELLQRGVKRVAAELRFTGVFLLIATQIASTNTGIDTALRTNLHQKMLLGTKPTENNRKLVFSDPERVPVVPDNIREDPGASRGVGTVEPESGSPTVFKSYFASVTDYAAWLDRLGVPVPGNPEPTKKQIAELMGESELVDRDTEREEMIERRRSMPDPVAGLVGDDDWDGQPLKGAALAAHQSAQLSALKKRKDADAVSV
ncbi:hypothetical protein LG293_16155 (plasmid) [Citricoccus nitrophenolicus]